MVTQTRSLAQNAQQTRASNGEYCKSFKHMRPRHCSLTQNPIYALVAHFLVAPYTNKNLFALAGALKADEANDWPSAPVHKNCSVARPFRSDPPSRCLPVQSTPA